MIIIYDILQASIIICFSGISQIIMLTSQYIAIYWNDKNATVDWLRNVRGLKSNAKRYFYIELKIRISSYLLRYNKNKIGLYLTMKYGLRYNCKRRYLWHLTTTIVTNREASYLP